VGDRVYLSPRRVQWCAERPSAPQGAHGSLLVALALLLTSLSLSFTIALIVDLSFERPLESSPRTRVIESNCVCRRFACRRRPEARALA
jgi:hypothetical protein